MKFKTLIYSSLIILTIGFFLVESTPELSFSKTKTAFADLDTCTGTDQPQKEPEAGNPCTCDGQFVIPQSCISGSGGCTPINCD